MHFDLISPLDNTRINLKRYKRQDAVSHAYDYDAIVIGAGPAGEAAAMKIAKSGQKLPWSIHANKWGATVPM